MNDRIRYFYFYYTNHLKTIVKEAGFKQGDELKAILEKKGKIKLKKKL